MQTDSVLPLDLVQPVLEMATEGITLALLLPTDGVTGCRQIYKLLQSEVRENAVHLLEAKGAQPSEGF